jgi:hypothetical protein
MRIWETKTDNSAPSSIGILSALEDNTRGKELENAVKLFGITVDPTTGADTRTNMLAEAMSRSSSYGTYGVATGTANSIIITEASPGVGLVVVVPKALFTGMRVHSKIPIVNTGPTTANVFSLGSKKVLTPAGAACSGGELLGDTVWEYDAALDSGAGAWRILAWGLAVTTSESVLEWQNLQIFPEVENSTGKLGITDNANGTITVQASQNVLWRGWERISTDAFSSGARTLTHLANKTYHLRYERGVGFSLKDLVNVGYNPTSLAEGDISFDTTYDNMLVARVITNGSNVPTIKPLVNRNRLSAEAVASGAASIYTSGSGSDGAQYDATFTLDWSRKPVSSLQGWAGQVAAPVLHGFANAIYYTSTRYSVVANVSSDFNTSGMVDPYGAIRLIAVT